MELFLSLFITTAFAAEMVFSPVPDDVLYSFGSPKMTIQKETYPDVSFGDIMITPTPIPTTTPTPIPSPTPSPFPTRTAKKNNFTIALLGDSMIDTLGNDLNILKQLLNKTYPQVNFTMKNYGVGATNIEYGIERITSGYTYLENPVPALVSQNPDVVVIESFGYNPFSFDTGAMDKHWLALGKAVSTIQSTLPNTKIVIGATIAPNWNVFGDGAAGLSFDPIAKSQKVTVIKKYLENAVNFAKSQGLPLADAYHPSLDGSGNGKLVYINPGDHIHYSDAGRNFFSQKIAGAIIANRLLE
jgi:lysophospholipase L1-like esterase